MANDLDSGAFLPLSEAVKHFNDEIAAGVADTVVTVAPFYELVPFIPVRGQALIVNQDATTGMVGFGEPDDDVQDNTTISKPMSVTSRTFTMKSLIGQANVDNFLQATSASAGVDQMALQIASKSRNIARKAYQQLAVGTDTTIGGEAAGFAGLTDIIQTTVDATAGGDVNQFDITTAANAFTMFDELLDAVTSKNGQVDFIMCSQDVANVYKSAVRAVGSGFDYFTTPITNRNILAYEGVPILINNYLKVDDDADIASGESGDTTRPVYAGCFESGGNDGLAMIYPEGTPAGIDVRILGESQKYNSQVGRVSMYTAAALYNDKGLARAFAKIA